VKRFDPDKGASFMTFMYFHLRGNLIRAVTGAVQDQALPQHDEMEVTGYAAECDNSATSVAQQRAPKIADIVEAFYSEERDMPEEMLYSKELNLVFQKVLSGLDELEREVINRLYFLEEQLVDIVERLGYSRCHISRVKKRALAILYAELSVALPHIQHSASGESSSKEWDNGFSDDEDREDGKKKYEYNSSTTCRLNKAPLHKFGLRNCNVDATRPIRRRRPRAGHARSRLLERISA
jgi:RNA polymerase sigma factor (sigma-70 family)